MGLLDRFAKRVAAEIEKAPRLPAGTGIMTEQQMRQAGGIAQTQYGYGTSTPLPRNSLLASVPFAPGLPLIPGALNPLNPETGRPAPRRYEYLVAQNINVTENRLVPFKTLRAAADQIDILRRCIEVRKAKITGLNWDIVISDAASERIIQESGAENHIRAMSKAREQFTDEISRLRKFWETPDPANGLSFVDWLNMAIEEIDVLDAWAIWPQSTVGGDIRGLQILDGSTIKPLLDDRGMRPEPSIGPAFQQILYGFPRSEFSATIDDEAADGEFTSDDLAYFVRNRRANSVYGYSPVERALPLADIYLRRQQWLRAEFTDGTMPKSFMELPADIQLTPEQIRQYENIYNDDLAGQTEQRNRLRILVPGGKLTSDPGYSEKFNDRLDDYLITSITGHFGVLPSEIGFSAKTGLGGSGHQQGEAEAAEQIGILPTARWISQMISNLSYRWLGMPRELEFKLMPSDRVDNEQIAKRDDIRTRNGSVTINENRADLGLPLLDTPEADMPMFVAGQSIFLLSPDGMVAAGTTLDEGGNVDEAPISPSESPADKPQDSEPAQDNKKSAQDEIKSFIRWVRKGNTNRAFNFEVVENTYAEVLNKFVEAKDLDGARWYAEHYLGL
jgi:Phage portal protein